MFHLAHVIYYLRKKSHKLPWLQKLLFLLLTLSDSFPESDTFFLLNTWNVKGSVICKCFMWPLILCISYICNLVFFDQEHQTRSRISSTTQGLRGSSVCLLNIMPNFQKKLLKNPLSLFEKARWKSKQEHTFKQFERHKK